jgi:predicted DCC family thiol-disulfide oxidoreductase YuxK
VSKSVNKSIVIIDGDCVFCNYWGNFIIKKDKSKKIHITAATSKIGIELIESTSKKIDINETIVFLKNENVYLYADAVLELIREMKNYILYPLLAGYIIPKSIRDNIYLFISKRRKKIMTNQCHIIDLREKERFIL